MNSSNAPWADEPFALIPTPGRGENVNKLDDAIHEHHEGEETFLFPRVEEITGVEGLMEVNVVQHHTFMNGSEEMQKYAKETKAEEYDGMKLRGIIDSFGGNLTKHLTEEVETLLGLKKYDGPVLRKAFVGFDDEMRKGDKSTLFPIVLGSSDISYEGGLDWPEVPGPIKALVHYWFERKYQGAWRFCLSTTWGERRQLLFTGKAD